MNFDVAWHLSRKIFPWTVGGSEVVGITLYINITSVNTIGFLEKKYAIDT